MRYEHEAMMVVRSQLCERLDMLKQQGRRHSAQDYTESVIGIRRLAAAYGLEPVVRLAEAFERAMTMPEAAGPCQKSLYVDRLYDAIGCERNDDAASEAMIASVSVRFV